MKRRSEIWRVARPLTTSLAMPCSRALRPCAAMPNQSKSRANALPRATGGWSSRRSPRSASARGVLVARPWVSNLFDPAGHLLALQPDVRRHYSATGLVLERIACERRGQDSVFALYEHVEQTAGSVAALNVMGCTVTFAAAALSVARLAPPRQGGRVFLHLRQELAQVGRLDLYEAILDLLGLASFAAPAVPHLLLEASEQCDMAVKLRQSGRWSEDAFGPSRHKLHRHLHPYFLAGFKAPRATRQCGTPPAWRPAS